MFKYERYAEGNLWFFMAVDEMRNGVFPDDQEFAKDMQFLASSYLSPESETQVNVSDELRESLTKMISGEKEATKTEVSIFRVRKVLSAKNYESAPIDIDLAKVLAQTLQ